MKPFSFAPLLVALCAPATLVRAQECSNCAYDIPDTVVAGNASGQTIEVRATNDIPVFALQAGLSFDASALELTGISRTGAVTENADFFESAIDAEAGVAAFAVLWDLSGDFSVKRLPPGDRHLIAVLEAESKVASGTTVVSFREVVVSAMSVIPIANVMSDPEGLSIRPALSDGTITIEDRTPRRVFIRGDPNDDLELNITDGIFVLNFLFTGGPDARCRDAMDANDTGTVDLTDGIYIFQFLFLGGPPPRPPFPEAGEDPTADPLPECVE